MFIISQVFWIELSICTLTSVKNSISACSKSNNNCDLHTEGTPLQLETENFKKILTATAKISHGVLFLFSCRVEKTHKGQRQGYQDKSKLDTVCISSYFHHRT